MTTSTIETDLNHPEQLFQIKFYIYIHERRLQTQLQTALILSVTFI